MEAACFSKMLVNYNWTTWHHIPENCILHVTDCCCYFCHYCCCKKLIITYIQFLTSLNLLDSHSCHVCNICLMNNVLYTMYWDVYILPLYKISCSYFQWSISYCCKIECFTFYKREKIKLTNVTYFSKFYLHTIILWCCISATVVSLVLFLLLATGK
jgi:hypothetical protein